MKATTAVAALLSLAPAVMAQSCPAPPPPPPPSGPSYFGGMSARSASPVHLLPVNARAGHIWLGGSTSSYCPNDPASCPPGNSTVFAGGDGTLSMAVVVPGGQQAYIAPDGALSYTTAHSAFKPAGSISDGFTKSEPTDGASFGHLSWTNGFVACQNEAGEWQVFGQVEGFSKTGCLGFDFLTINATAAGAWQYA